MLGLKRHCCFLLAFIWLMVGYTQKTSPPDASPLLLENIHLHLNKTTFLKGEHLWFKAYIQNRLNQLPSAETTNLHVGIFSEEGDMLVKKMFLVNNGMCSGDFGIDSTFVAESYTVMAWTHYMKNFEEATPFLQKINIVGATREKEQSMKEEVTILLQPEGQHIVPNAFNTIGITVLDETQHPIETDAIQLITDEGVPIQSNIQTNALGQGRFGFFADPKQSYSLKFQNSSGAWMTKKLEKHLYATSGISINNTGEDVILLKPKWSDSLTDSKKSQKFTLAIYTTNDISFKKEYARDEDNTVISINRNEIPYGVHSAVLLDETMQPLAQRIFFNQYEAQKRVFPVEVDYCLNKAQDSLQLDFILPKGSASANISVSVIPAESSAYSPNNGIGSSFLVQPYLKQQLVQGNYFFDGIKRSINYQLDTRLLMEGTDKLGWNLSSMDARPISYASENYIPLQGKILDADTKTEKQVSIMSQSFGTMNLLDLASNKSFTGKLPLFQGDSILISVLNQKGKLRKPKAELYFNTTKKDSFDYSKWLRHRNPITIRPKVPKNEESLNLSERTIALEEVVVSQKVQPKTKFQITTEIEGRNIDETAVKRYKSFATYIRKLGFQIRPNVLEGGIRIYVVHPPSPGGLYPAIVTIEGTNVSAGELMNMPLSSIKTIVFNRFVRPHIGPFISLSLRYDYDSLLGKGKFARLAIPEGYSRIQNYFPPNYPDFTSFLFRKYGAVWWENQLEVDSDVPKSIKVPLNGQQTVKIIVEGMSAEGLLYETELICNPFENGYSEN